jgi:hypothetical protein
MQLVSESGRYEKDTIRQPGIMSSLNPSELNDENEEHCFNPQIMSIHEQEESLL